MVLQVNPCDNNTFSIHDNIVQNIKGRTTSNTDGIGIQIWNDSGSGNRTISNNTIINTEIGIDILNSQLDIFWQHNRQNIERK